jgi:hypothetical protein
MAALKVANLDKRVYDLLADWRQSGSSSWDSGFLAMIRRLLPWFEDEGVVYAFSYGVAIRLHGGECGQCASMAMTWASWERLARSNRPEFDVRPDGANGILSVRGLLYGSTVRFVESLETMRVSIHGVWVLSLPHLIGNLLERPSEVSRGYVIGMIRANGLGGDFRHDLPEDRRAAYDSSLRSARRRKKPPDGG